MGQYLSWDRAELTFRPEATIGDVDQLWQDIQELAERASRDGDARISLWPTLEGCLLKIDRLYGFNIYLDEVLAPYAHLLENTRAFHGTCDEGDGHFFWRIRDGVWEQCGADIQPSGDWVAS